MRQNKIPRVLITRPLEDALIMQEQLAELGVHGVICSLSTIKVLKDALPRLQEACETKETSGIAVTSRHAVRILAQATGKRHLPLYAIAEATARAATQAGFAQTVNVAAADHIAPDKRGTAQAFVDYFQHHALKRPEKESRILYPSAVAPRQDLSALLATCDFTVITIPCYQAEYIDAFPNAIIEEWSRLDAVTLMSARTARHFAALCRQHQLSCAHLQAVLLHERYQESISGLGFGAFHIAQEPTSKALRRCVANLS